MTLDREAARALFDNAETTPTPTAAPAAARPLYVEPRPAARVAPEAVDETPFVAAGSPYERMNGGAKTRKGLDWRIAAPLGAAALCAGAVALIVIPRNDTVDGKTVASSEIVAPPMAQPAPVPAPAEMAATDSIDTPAPAAMPAPTPAPTVQRASSRPAPVAVRRAPAREVAAAAPSASDSASNVSAREPYLPTPTLGAETPVALTPTTPAPAPTATPPIVAPAAPTPPMVEPTPQ